MKFQGWVYSFTKVESQYNLNYFNIKFKKKQINNINN